MYPKLRRPIATMGKHVSAAKTLFISRIKNADAGVKTPVPLEIWWTPSHYGPVSSDEYAQIKHQLDASGLFNVTLKSTEWNQYDTDAFTNKYPAYQLGWFPDYPGDVPAGAFPAGWVPERARAAS